MCLCPRDGYRLVENFEDYMTDDIKASYIADKLTVNWLPKVFFGFKRVPKWCEGLYEHVLIPCGKCIECKLKHSKSWALRCMHEAQYHKESCFLTITYNDKYVPKNNGDLTLHYFDMQKIMKLIKITI